MGISKELLSEVLGKKVDKVYTADNEGNNFKTFVRPRFGDFVDEINIYELAHRHKEWAWNNGYEISSFKANHSGYWLAIVKIIDFNIPPLGFTDNTEPKVIFKACEWILENKDK